MAVKAESVIEVDVKDEKFKSFLDAFYKYRNAADKLPKTWAGISKENQAQASAIKIMTAALFAQQEVLKTSETRTKRIADNTRQTAQYWKDVAASTKRYADNVHNAVTRLARFTGIGTLISGLITGGSILGLEHLARSAGAGLKSSVGQGLTFGKQNAFNISYGRLLENSGGFLSGVSTGRGDVSSDAAGALYTLGLDPTKGGDTGDVAKEALARIRKIAKETPENQLGMLPYTHNLGALGIGLGDIRNLRNSSDEDYSKFEKEYTHQQSQLDVNQKLLRSWQDLDTQLQVAEKNIEKVFLVALQGLTEPLGEASKAFAELIKVLTDTGAFKWVIEQITMGLREFADYVKRDEFKQDVKSFVDSIAILAQKTASVLRWLGLLPDNAPAKANPNYVDPTSPDVSTTMPPAGAADNRYNRAVNGATGGSWYQSIRKFLTGKDTADSEMEAYKKTVAGNETSGYADPYSAVNTSSGALGKYQVMPDNVPRWSKMALGQSLTPAQYLASPDAQEKVFEKMFGDMVRKYGNLQDALSEWHSGSDLNTARRRGANDGNMSTVDYVAKGMRTYQGITVKVAVDNNTGGAASVSAAAAATGGAAP